MNSNFSKIKKKKKNELREQRVSTCWQVTCGHTSMYLFNRSHPRTLSDSEKEAGAFRLQGNVSTASLVPDQVLTLHLLPPSLASPWILTWHVRKVERNLNMYKESHCTLALLRLCNLSLPKSASGSNFCLTPRVWGMWWGEWHHQRFCQLNGLCLDLCHLGTSGADSARKEGSWSCNMITMNQLIEALCVLWERPFGLRQPYGIPLIPPVLAVWACMGYISSLCFSSLNCEVGIIILTMEDVWGLN